MNINFQSKRNSLKLRSFFFRADYVRPLSLVNAKNQLKLQNGKQSDDEIPEMRVGSKMTIYPPQDGCFLDYTMNGERSGEQKSWPLSKKERNEKRITGLLNGEILPKCVAVWPWCRTPDVSQIVSQYGGMMFILKSWLFGVFTLLLYFMLMHIFTENWMWYCVTVKIERKTCITIHFLS